MALDRLDDLYRDAILDHRRNPRNHARLPNPDIIGKAINPFCGDEIHLQLALDAHGRIADVGLQGEGCSINLAAGSMLTEVISGKTLDEISVLADRFRKMMRGDADAEMMLRSNGDLYNLSGVRDYPVRIKCALLPLSALTKAVTAYRQSRSDEADNAHLPPTVYSG